MSWLRICSKIFKRVVNNDIYNCFIDNDLTSQNQSGFKRGESCGNQLSSNLHNILNYLVEVLEVRGVSNVFRYL